MGVTYYFQPGWLVLRLGFWAWARICGLGPLIWGVEALHRVRSQGRGARVVERAGAGNWQLQLFFPSLRQGSGFDCFDVF